MEEAHWVKFARLKNMIEMVFFGYLITMNVLKLERNGWR